MNEPETKYAIRLEVYNEKDELVYTPDRKDKFTGLRFDMVVPDNERGRGEMLQHKMTEIVKDMQILLPAHKIYISASVLSEINHTYMEMFSYYGPENRWVIHT